MRQWARRAIVFWAVTVAAGVWGSGLQRCSAETILLHADETYEYGYAWRWGEQVPPDYGAFAESYRGEWVVHGIILDLTTVWWYMGLSLDVYVWGNDGGIPGGVLALLPDVDPGQVALWPEVSRHRFDLATPVSVSGDWWIGWWGRWAGTLEGYYIAADLDGPGGGRPMTKIAPGLEWPSGWQDVAVRWFPTAALGIGAEVEAATPARAVSWGSIKKCFAR